MPIDRLKAELRKPRCTRRITCLAAQPLATHEPPGAFILQHHTVAEPLLQRAAHHAHTLHLLDHFRWHPGLQGTQQLRAAAHPAQVCCSESLPWKCFDRAWRERVVFACSGPPQCCSAWCITGHSSFQVAHCPPRLLWCHQRCFQHQVAADR